MTGFAAARGAAEGHAWAWEMRGVNARGLDLRLRLPDGVPGLEPALRARIGRAVARGSITLSLRLSRDEAAVRLRLDPAALEAALAAISEIEMHAARAGVGLAPPRASEIMALRGVLDSASAEDDPAPLLAALLADFEPLLESFLHMRRQEGRALERVLEAQLDATAGLVEAAAEIAEARRDDSARALREALARVTQNEPAADPDRVAQELALLAVKADITEELDRLRAHISAARALLGEGGTVGRKLDFLMQEFNREANTLCAKSGHADLTRAGLELKAVIEQMREQVQNVE